MRLLFKLLCATVWRKKRNREKGFLHINSQKIEHVRIDFNTKITHSNYMGNKQIA